MDCPTCTESFDTSRSMKIHHKLSHGESIALDSSTCSECGKEFDYYPSNKEGIYCSNCVENPNVTWSNGKLTGEDNGMYGANGEENPMYGKTGNSSPVWKGGYDNYTSGWNESKKKALSRDSFTCQICGDNKYDLGQNPDVHHIIPSRKFDNVENSHDLDNLICLCKSCHGKVEHGSLTLDN